MFLRRKLLTFKMGENNDLELHILEFDKIVRELKVSGANLGGEDAICQLLLSLPKHFKPVSTALETISPDKLTMDLVKGRLLGFEIKRRHSFEYEYKLPDSPILSNVKKRGHMF